MASTLQYDFAVIGTAAIRRALRGIETSFAQHNARMAQISNRAVGSGRGGPYRTSAAAARGASPAAAKRDAIRGFDQIGNAARAMYLKEGRDRVRIEQQTNRRIERERLANIRRIAAAEARAARAAGAARARFARSTMGVAGRSVGGSLRAVGGLAMGGLAIGGGFAAANAINSEKSLRAASAALANQAYNTPGETRSRRDIQDSVDKQARTLGISTGLGRENIVGGLRNFAAIAGNVSAGQQMMPHLADVSQATDADIGDVGRTAGQIFQTLATRYDVSKPAEMAKAIKETEDIIGSMAGQAKVGSIEFKDLATQMGKLMSATAGFEGNVSDLTGTMGAVAQLAIAGGASSPEEAMTSIMRFRDDIIQNQKRFKAAGGGTGGVNVFSNKEQTALRGPEEILFDMLKVTKGNLPEVGKLFGVRAQKAVQPFQKVYTDAGGGKAGEQAVQRILNNVKGAKMSQKEIAESAAFRREQADVKMAVAVEKFNEVVGTKLLPALTDLIPNLVKLVPIISKAADAFSRFVQTLSENPGGTIAKLIAAKLVLDIAAAGIGARIKSAIVAAITGKGGTSGGVVAGGGKGGKSNVLGSVSLGASIGLTVGTAILTAGIVNFEATEASLANSGKDLVAARGSSDPEEIKKLRQEEIKRLGQAKSPGMVETAVGAYFSGHDWLAKQLGGKGDTGSKIAQGSAEFVTERNTNEIKTREANVKELGDLLHAAELKSAAEAQKQAAQATKEAAAAMKTAADAGGPNRGNTPSPAGGK